MFQTKEQDKTPGKNPKRMEIDNLPDEEFKVVVLNILTKLGRRMEEHGEIFNKMLENIRENQSELKSTVTKMKNTLEGITSRLDDTEEQINDLKDEIVEIIKSEHQ